jgi:hypothetical protein
MAAEMFYYLSASPVAEGDYTWLLTYQETRDEPFGVSGVSLEITQPDDELYAGDVDVRLPAAEDDVQTAQVFFTPPTRGIYLVQWTLTYSDNSTRRFTELVIVSETDLVRSLNNKLASEMEEEEINQLLAEVIKRAEELYPCIAEQGGYAGLSKKDALEFEFAILHIAAIKGEGTPASRKGTVTRIKVAAVIEKTFASTQASGDARREWARIARSAMNRIACVNALLPASTGNVGNIFVTNPMREGAVISPDDLFGRLLSS